MPPLLGVAHVPEGMALPGCGVPPLSCPARLLRSLILARGDGGCLGSWAVVITPFILRAACRRCHALPGCFAALCWRRAMAGAWGLGLLL